MSPASPPYSHWGSSRLRDLLMSEHLLDSQLGPRWERDLSLPPSTRRRSPTSFRVTLDASRHISVMRAPAGWSVVVLRWVPVRDNGEREYDPHYSAVTSPGDEPHE
ncbi:unnamed protein product [Pleuronectes platessa]|uniref:Uncharacterized protein n=1 Tax=Pleuronectes platessa TaxID=8262 RepID=A0A9N7YS62_PLEPL|nr:unnamed protein product [Pleuronectes platessa]